MNSLKDDVGYCVYVAVDAVKVIKMKASDFAKHDFALTWIKTLLEEDPDKLESDRSVYLEGVYRQFTDPAIDIFVNTDGIGKGYLALATTNKGITLYGNFVVLGNDKGETVLLTKTQTQIALQELGFYKDYGDVKIVDTTGESEYLQPEDHPQVLKDLLGGLIDYCVDKEIQLLTRAGNLHDPDNGALVVCLHGESDFIHDCHLLLKDFITLRDKLISDEGTL